MSDCESVPRGLLRISAPITFAVVTLTKRIPEFLKRFPHIRLDLNMDDHTVDFLHDNYDLVIRANAAKCRIHHLSLVSS